MAHRDADRSKASQSWVCFRCTHPCLPPFVPNPPAPPRKPFCPKIMRSSSSNNDEEGQFVNDGSQHHHSSTTLNVTMGALELEMEEEQESLLDETLNENGTDHKSRAATHLKFRKAAASKAAAIAVSTPQRVLGFLRERIGHHFTNRNVAVLVLLMVLVVLMLRVDSELESEYMPVEVLPKSPHQSSFSDELPKSNVDGAKVPSIHPENWRNEIGFYWHHPFASPYSVDLYNLDNATKADLQREFETKRQVTVDKFGLWAHPKADGVTFPRVDPTEDVSLSTFKPSYWQVNPTYLKSFLSEGLKLVKRVQMGVYEEYGHAKPSDSDVTRLFGIATVQNQSDFAAFVQHQQGITVMTDTAWEALVRKLWHAMVTHDTLFVVTVGDPSSHVNWARNSAMQFHYILEPVLDMLGVRLITRNMGGPTPTISSLGGADVWGEADLLVVYNEEFLSSNERELLHRQAILSGSRVPVILESSFNIGSAPHAPDDLLTEAWLGRILSGKQVCPMTKRNDVPESPVACQYLNCDRALKRTGTCNVYNDVCWVDRKDYSPQSQDESIEDHLFVISNAAPLNDRENQWEGRKLSLVVLKALSETLRRWKNEITHGRPILPDNLWHVRSTYRAVRESVRTHRDRASGTAGGLVGPTPCEQLLAAVDPMICHMRMHVLTEWTPRVEFDANGLKDRITTEYVDPSASVEEAYRGHDLLPLQWRLDNTDEVDVHLIAVATNESTEEFAEQTMGQGQGEAGNKADRRHGIRILKKKAKPPPTNSKWVLYNAPIGFCDGSSQSTCNRRPDNPCFLANRNYYRVGLLGTAQSGWLNFTVPFVSEGVILLRLDWTMDLGVSGAKAGDLRSEDRLENLPDDFVFDYSIGQDEFSLSRSEFLNFGRRIVDDLIVYPVLMNPAMSHNATVATRQVDVGLRVRSSSPSSFPILLTHVYYA